MTEKTYFHLSAAVRRAKFETRQSWLAAWTLGHHPSELATHFAQELQDLNDVHRELEQLYYAGLSRAIVNESLS